WLMLQQDKADDFVLATGVTTTVRDFIVLAFNEVGIEIEFSGKAENEIAVVKKCNNPAYQVPVGNVVMKIDPKYYRPSEVELLIGDPAKAKKVLGWEPKHNLASIVKEMMNCDLELFKRDQYLKQGGHKIINYHEA
ncbi:MAG TPA: GDP-mannose 4,6-dehydratase, partial [Bacteroidia bacterium]|nr:GDP-mannose 4,6-dehydratase [Bacteroidia bacterium]